MFVEHRKIFISLFVVLVTVLVFLYGSKSKNAVILNGKEFVVELARSRAELQMGLSGRKSLSEDRGLLFVFDKPGNYGFWMKDMNFPIDIIWISGEGKIIHIEKSLSPETYPTIYYPSASALYVLEISAGQAEILNLKIGDIVKF